MKTPMETSAREKARGNRAVRRGDDETRKLREKNADLAKTVAKFEDRERLEREVAANSSSLGEKEMMRRLERSDPRMAMTTLVRNLCAKNKQIASQQEQYDALARKVREKEKYVKFMGQEIIERAQDPQLARLDQFLNYVRKHMPKSTAKGVSISSIRNGAWKSTQRPTPQEIKTLAQIACSKGLVSVLNGGKEVRAV